MTKTAFLYGHERLLAWQKAMDLLVACYGIARKLPAYERYGLAAQIRRAAVSIPANIAEGCGRIGPRDRLRFYSFARASICELQTLLAAVELLHFAAPPDHVAPQDILGQVGRLVGGMRRRETALAKGKSSH